MPTKTLPNGGATHLKLLREMTDRPVEEVDAGLQDDDPVWWAERNLRTEQGKRLDFVDHPYLEMPLEDWHPRLVFKKGAQVGMTQTTTAKMLFFCLHYKITGIYTMPTQQLVERYSTSRFNRIIGRNPEVQSKIYVNNAGFKQIGESQFYFSGTFNETQAISTPSDVNSHDELDFSKDDVLDLYPERLAHSPYAFQWLFSTPTIEEFGIDAEFIKSDQRHWFIKCSGCGRWQRMRFDIPRYADKHNIREIHKWGRHIRWYFGCNRCDKELDRRNGEWVVKKGANGHFAHGYHIPQTIVPVIDAETLKDKYKDAERKKNLKKFYNFNLGEAYSVGKVLINRELIRARTRVFADAYQTTRWFMGVDQGDVKHWVLARRYNDRRLIVRWGNATEWDEIYTIWGQYRPKCTVVDALPNKDNAKAFRDKFPGKVYIAYYKDNQPSMLKKNRDTDQITEVLSKEVYAFSVDHLESLDRSAADWVAGDAWLNGYPDAITNLNSMEYMFADHMSNLKRDEEEDKHGNMVGRWVKVGPDHFRHADNYVRIAMEIWGNEEYDLRTGGSDIIPFEGDGGVTWTEHEGLLVPKKGDIEFDA